MEGSFTCSRLWGCAGLSKLNGQHHHPFPRQGRSVDVRSDHKPSLNQPEPNRSVQGSHRSISGVSQRISPLKIFHNHGQHHPPMAGKVLSQRNVTPREATTPATVGPGTEFRQQTWCLVSKAAVSSTHLQQVWEEHVRMDVIIVCSAFPGQAVLHLLTRR